MQTPRMAAAVSKVPEFFNRSALKMEIVIFERRFGIVINGKRLSQFVRFQSSTGVARPAEEFSKVFGSEQDSDEL
jgi:hypothetical protein